MSSGVGLPTIVFIVFLILKLVGVIDWSWWWVTAPLWGPVAVAVVILVAAAIIVFIAYLVKSLIGVYLDWRMSRYTR